MSRTFTKLFSSITESTIWVADSPTRIVWITMLAMADHAGRVWGSIPGLANRARVSVAEAETALQAFLSPDSYSRTKDHEGRRVEAIDGGWRLLNHAKYRAIRDEESVKQSKRDYINNKRAAERQDVEPHVENVDICRHNADAYTEADAEEPKPTPSLRELACQQVYELYPRKVSKPTGLKAIEKAIQRETKKLGGFDAALAYLKIQTEKYQRSPGVITRIGRQEINFIPYPATWFRQERYNDEHDWGKERTNGLSKDQQRTERNKKAIARALGGDVE